jgi:hypothetical protein
MLCRFFCADAVLRGCAFLAGVRVVVDALPDSLAGTTTAPKSLPTEPVEATPALTAVMGSSLSTVLS